MNNPKGCGRHRTQHGYIVVFSPDHARADMNGYVLEHILVWEQVHGCPIGEGYCVHHINGKKDDNRPENLLRMSFGEHTAFHHTGKKRSADTRKKLSEKAKKRFSKKENHPSYKPVDVEEMIAFRKSGHTVVEVCEKYSISRKTFYNKVREYESDLYESNKCKVKYHKRRNLS